MGALQNVLASHLSRDKVETMSTLALNDAQKSIALTVSVAAETDDPYILGFLTALDTMNATLPIASISLSGATYMVTLKDARTYTVAIQVGSPPTFQITSTAYWSKGEETILQILGLALNNLILVDGMTALTVTYN
jgi:hypothetical protein